LPAPWSGAIVLNLHSPPPSSVGAGWMGPATATNRSGPTRPPRHRGACSVLPMAGWMIIRLTALSRQGASTRVGTTAFHEGERQGSTAHPRAAWERRISRTIEERLDRPIHARTRGNDMVRAAATSSGRGTSTQRGNDWSSALGSVLVVGTSTHAWERRRGCNRTGERIGTSTHGWERPAASSRVRRSRSAHPRTRGND
jgi:hypothetical protein